MRNAKLFAIAAGTTLLAGCYSGPAPVRVTETVTPTVEVMEVPWGDYAPELQSQIDALAAASDCDGLQQQFDTADANNAATLDRTGHNNADLMTYIDGQLREAGCY